jgi:ABC-type molybdate transport system permease subunit
MQRRSDELAATGLATGVADLAAGGNHHRHFVVAGCAAGLPHCAQPQPFQACVESLVSMPLVLPPSVLGFYLLLIFSPRYAFGQWLEQTLHLKLVFSFSGLVIGSVLFSLPFMVQPVQAAFQYLPRSLLEASRTLGKSDTESFSA